MRRILLAAAGALLASAGTASAQGLEFKPIDTNKAIVQPTDATTGILTSTTRYVFRLRLLRCLRPSIQPSSVPAARSSSVAFGNSSQSERSVYSERLR